MKPRWDDVKKDISLKELLLKMEYMYQEDLSRSYLCKNKKHLDPSIFIFGDIFFEYNASILRFFEVDIP